MERQQPGTHRKEALLTAPQYALCYHTSVAVTVDDGLVSVLAEVASKQRGLSLLLLYGSRARGDAASTSDWDLGYLADDRFDPDGMLADLVAPLGTERVDLVDLDRAAGLLRYRAVRDGVPVFERRAGVFAEFWFEAVSFWCDASPVLHAGYADILAELDS